MPAPLSHLFMIIFFSFCICMSSFDDFSSLGDRLHLAGFLFSGSVSSDFTAPKNVCNQFGVLWFLERSDFFSFLNILGPFCCSCSLPYQNYIHFMVLSKYLKSVRTWVQSNLFGKTEKFRPLFDKSSIIFVRTKLDMLNTMVNICFLNFIFWFLLNYFFIDSVFLIFSGLGSSSSGIEWHVLPVLVSGSKCLWTLGALAPVGSSRPPAPGCFFCL